MLLVGLGLAACSGGSGADDGREGGVGKTEALTPILEVPQQGPEATSLLGKPLHAPAIDAETRAKREDELARALSRYRQDHLDEENIIWLGRRLHDRIEEELFYAICYAMLFVVGLRLLYEGAVG